MVRVKSRASRPTRPVGAARPTPAAAPAPAPRSPPVSYSWDFDFDFECTDFFDGAGPVPTDDRDDCGGEIARATPDGAEGSDGDRGDGDGDGDGGDGDGGDGREGDETVRGAPRRRERQSLRRYLPGLGPASHWSDLEPAAARAEPRESFVTPAPATPVAVAVRTATSPVSRSTRARLPLQQYLPGVGPDSSWSEGSSKRARVAR